MPLTTARIKLAPWLAAAFLCLHLLGAVCFAERPSAISYAFQILAPLLALAICIRHTRLPSSRMWVNWSLLSLALAFWTIGILLSAFGELFEHISGNSAYASDFAYFFYGVPILLAISAPRNGQSSRVFRTIDAIQAVIAGCLAYLRLFSTLPFTGRPVTPITTSLLVTTYNIENLVLAATATLRLLSCRKGTNEHAFYRILSLFLWTYALFAATYNYLDFSSVTLAKFGSVPFDLLTDIPFLLITVLVLKLKPIAPSERAHAQQGALALFIDNGSPIFFTFAILALGVSIARTHFTIGVGSMVAALILYGFRATALQSRYVRSQQELQEARDRLEKLSLQDGLTGVANRRSFDQNLLQEWNRGIRTQQPISLLLVDIDYFKNLNDTHGHLWGDDCLALIAHTLLAVLPRSTDLLARYGGEEFAAILPATDRAGALVIALKMAAAIATLQIPNPTPTGPFVTVSIGIATHPQANNYPQPTNPTQLLEATDRALYKAKQNGRNRIESATL